MEEKAKKTTRKANLFEAMLSLLFLIAIMAVGIIVWSRPPYPDVHRRGRRGFDGAVAGL